MKPPKDFPRSYVEFAHPQSDYARKYKFLDSGCFVTTHKGKPRGGFATEKEAKERLKLLKEKATK